MDKDYRGRGIGTALMKQNRFLVKPAKTAVARMPNGNRELAYDRVKQMQLVDDVENKKFLGELLKAIYEELPTPKNDNIIWRGAVTNIV